MSSPSPQLADGMPVGATVSREFAILSSQALQQNQGFLIAVRDGGHWERVTATLAALQVEPMGKRTVGREVPDLLELGVSLAHRDAVALVAAVDLWPRASRDELDEWLLWSSSTSKRRRWSHLLRYHLRPYPRLRSMLRRLSGSHSRGHVA